MCKNAVKKLPFVIKYVSDRYQIKGMCNKVIVENGGMLEFVPDWIVSTYLSAIQFVPECKKSLEMCVKAVTTCFFVFDFVPYWYMTQKMFDKVASK